MITATGKDLIRAVANQLNDEDIRCYDSEIVRRISSMTMVQLRVLLDDSELTRYEPIARAEGSI